ncbi:hypothetical protein KOI35_44945 [Actinoplanes bogorensis]|uniref:Lipoprotein n=1 Tax=Paractinoplanes bogorensis TaxID=1610840 RepID=A0ABS5Z5P2_9ACTN|nr:hypothetical protein [Actinoplanes bogorensis]MBU2670671.1 hypothetical protein [Actinoplanes bogorensis]
MLSARRTASTLMAALVFAGLAACSNTAEAEGPGPIYDTGPPGSEISDEVYNALGPLLVMKFDITGAATVKGTTTATAPSGGRGPLATCSEYAGGTADNEYIMAGELDESVGDVGVSMELRIANYAGPGTYPKSQLVAAEGRRPSIWIEDDNYDISRDSTTGQVTTDGKGGGKWTFTNLASTRGGDTITGTVSWTCEKRKPRKTS